MNDTIMLKEIFEQVNNIEECHNYNVNNIKHISDEIRKFNPQNIVIVGRGTSIHAGIYARYLLELYYHKPVSIASQSIFTIYGSNTDMSKSLVIGISQSGGGQDTLTVLKRAKEKGALTLSIVNNLESDIAKSTDYTLYCNAGEAIAVPATKTFITTLYLINSLVLALTNDEHAKINKENIKQAIENGYRFHDKIKEVIKMVNSNSIFVLGRGLTLPLAMETALKITETSHTHVSSYPISEFYHGPIAMINDNIPTIVFGIEREFDDDVGNIIKRLKQKNVPVLLITNNKDLTKNVDDHIYIESQEKFETYFTAIVIIQLLACELSLFKGYNPDIDEELLNVKTF